MIVQERIQMVDGGVTYKIYSKIKDIGSGSFSKVWLVETSGSKKTYALKIITKKQMKILESERLVEEVKVHQSLMHPHVVYLDHCFQDEDYKYILLEYCEKGTLDNVFGQGPVEEQDIRIYGRQMVEALTYLHSKRILHRDLKLSNFFVDGDNNIKLGDFGFACKLQYEGELRRETCGTPNYIAPEVIGGFGYSFPSDVWSFGAILYKIKFGTSPFESNTLKETLQNVKLANYTFPKKIKISSQLQDLITQILCVNYDDRPNLEQIAKHSFFLKDSTSPSQLKKQGSFSNFFSKLLSRSRSKSKKQGSLHKIGSCNNLRDMKTILRDKTSTIDQDAYYNMGMKTEMRSTFLSPPSKFPIPSSKMIREPAKSKSLMVTQFYPGVIPHQVTQQKQYTIVYLTNGLRQIINEKNTILISPTNEYFGKDGKKCEPSKIMLYISKTYLKPSPIQCPNLKLELAHKNYIVDWRMSGGYFVMTIGAACVVPVGDQKQKLIYLHLKQTSYLYNRSLEIVPNEQTLKKMAKLMSQGQIVRMKSPGQRKLL